MDVFEELYRRESKLSFKRAGLAGRISASIFYLDMILTPEQKEHFSYKSLAESINDLQDSYYVREEEELAL